MTTDRTEPIPLRDVPKVLPKRDGKRVSLATVSRWVRKGLKGVKLEAWYVGGQRCTNQLALDRFDQSVTAAYAGATKPEKPTRNSIRAASDLARRKLLER